MKTQKIEFFPVSNICMFPPTPASKIVPEWYKQLPGYIGGKKTRTHKTQDQGDGLSTIKRCMPVTDAIMSGYIFYTQADVWLSNTLVNENNEIVEGKGWEFPISDEHYKPLSFHNKKQLEGHPALQHEKHLALKFENTWAMKTPQGYSTLFINLLHRENNIFRILEGIVDTDSYYGPVNFPFVLIDPMWEGLISAGTPVAQVIPIKRDSWEMEITQGIPNWRKYLEAALHSSWWGGYRNRFWNRKEYK